MSRNSQGVSARKLLNRPASAGMRLGVDDDLLADVLQRRQAVVAAVLDDDLEAAGGAQAVDRRGAEDVDQPVLDLLLEIGLQLGGDASRRKGRVAARSVEVVEHHVHRAEIGGVGAQQDRLAGDGHGVLHAGVLVGDLLDAVHDPLGPLHGGRVGQLHVHQQVALVLRGNEARRATS